MTQARYAPTTSPATRHDDHSRQAQLTLSCQHAGEPDRQLGRGRDAAGLQNRQHEDGGVAVRRDEVGQVDAARAPGNPTGAAEGSPGKERPGEANFR